MAGPLAVGLVSDTLARSHYDDGCVVYLIPYKVMAQMEYQARSLLEPWELFDALTQPNGSLPSSQLNTSEMKSCSGDHEGQSSTRANCDFSLNCGYPDDDLRPNNNPFAIYPI